VRRAMATHNTTMTEFAANAHCHALIRDTAGPIEGDQLDHVVHAFMEAAAANADRGKL